MSLLDDLVPEPLQHWDPALLDRLRLEGKGETLFFEFKSQFDCADVEKTVCAFANRLGGYLLFGVVANSENTIASYPGLDPNEDWLRRVSDCVVGHVSPLPIWDTVSLASPDATDRRVVVTRVEASGRTPHVLSRNGVIYVRNPAGSDPVRDKATLDALVTRGSHGALSTGLRADSLHSNAPGTELFHPGIPYSYAVQIAVVPSPPLEDGAALDLLTQSGMNTAGRVFTHPSVRGLAPKSLGEDRVMLASGLQVAARFVDGAIFVCERSQSGYVGAKQLVDLISGVLGAASYQHPPVHQALLDVRLINASQCRVDEDSTGRNPSARALAVTLWPWRLETGTEIEAAHHAAATCGRRLWRAVGDTRGLEPG
jgi:hypothetical protein